MYWRRSTHRCAAPIDVSSRAADDLVRRGLDDAAGRNEFRRRQIERPLRLCQRCWLAGTREIDGTIARRDPAGDFDDRSRARLPCRRLHPRAIRRDAMLGGLAAYDLPGIAKRLDPVRRRDGRQRHPGP
jgi:hypothetical protein